MRALRPSAHTFSCTAPALCPALHNRLAARTCSQAAATDKSYARTSYASGEDADERAASRQPPPGPEPLQAQHVADWTRLAAIARYGGVHIDASSVTLQTLENVFDPAFDGLQGFTLGVSSAFSSSNVSSLPGHEQVVR